MKTKEIRKVLEGFCRELIKTKCDGAYSYKLEETHSRIKIEKTWNDEIDESIVIVNKDNSHYQIIVDENDGITSSDLQAIFKAVKEYANTPLEERKDEKRWHIHLFKGGCNYLNQDKEKGTYELDTKYEINDYKTEFTRSDIEDWIGTKDSKIIDLIINRFGEEVKE